MTYSQIFGREPNKDEVISSIEKSNLDETATENVKNVYLNFFK